MLGLKRRPVVDENGVNTGSEQWLDFYKRSMSRAGTEIRTRNMGMTNLVGKEVRRWADHISRMGLEGKPEHFVKGLVSWRCRYWWESQKTYNELSWDPILHVFPFKPARWEDRFPTDWMTGFSQYPITYKPSDSQELFIPV